MPSPGDSNKPAGACGARSMSARRAPCSAARSAVAAPSTPNAPVIATALPLTLDVMSNLLLALRDPEYHPGSCYRPSRAQDDPLLLLALTLRLAARRVLT